MKSIKSTPIVMLLMSIIFLVGCSGGEEIKVGMKIGDVKRILSSNGAKPIALSSQPPKGYLLHEVSIPGNRYLIIRYNESSNVIESISICNNPDEPKGRQKTELINSLKL